MYLNKYKSKFLQKCQKLLSKEHRALVTATSVAAGVILLRTLGLLQALELAAFDQTLTFRPREKPDERVIIVTIEEADLQQYGFPIPDNILAKLLLKIDSAKPRAIGLDLYRNLPVEPGSAELHEVLANIPNIIGIELIAHNETLAVQPHPLLKKQKRIGINNVMRDIDNKVRRGILYWWTKDGTQYQSLSLKLALIYLEKERIKPNFVKQNNSEYLQLGKGIIYPFEANDGGYVNADAGGYQFIANLRGPANTFRMVSMQQVLNGEVTKEMRDKIVLIGATAPSVKDFHLTSYSGNFWQAPQLMSGVEQHANLVSQLISSALDGRQGIEVLPEPVEWLWIWLWSLLGANLAWRFRSPRKSLSLIFFAGISLTFIAYLSISYGWWIPLIPPLMALGGSTLVIVTYLALMEEELKRSKEFLQTIINTIPDPIFVKNQDHRRIVLNQAYCRFINLPLDQLMTKTDYDLFPSYQADVFWQQDERVFQTRQDYENEEEFTDAKGNTYLIATKRSLHQDAAGNLFLVGVIRDITERKRMEETLKQKTAELERYNEQLKLSEDFLRYRAYHDPLTGLPNRQSFTERLYQSLEWAKDQEKMVALLFIDLDGFKAINDTLGHDMGDLLLQAVAERLKGCLRGSDTVCRLAGDEFTVILPGIPGEPDAIRVADKIIKTIEKQFILKGNQLTVTMSVGISLYPVHALDMETLTTKADRAMYVAKKNGKNRYELAKDINNC